MKLALLGKWVAVSPVKAKNVERLCSFRKEVGANLVCLPKRFNAPHGVKYFNQYVESIPGYTSQVLSKSTKENEIYLFRGTFPKRDDKKLHSTYVACDPDGELLTKYAMKLALIQFAVSPVKEKNIERVCSFIKEAAQNGANLVCLPECFNAPYGVKYFNQYAESIPGYTSQVLSQSAKENKIYLVGGTFPERDNEKLFNTCLAFGPDGELLAKHRKVHLFDIDIPGKITFKESTALAAGDSLTTFKIGEWNIGLGICYDIRFPIMANIYAKKGCQLLVYPGAFNLTTGAAHWELLQRARALDNQLYVATVSPARDETAPYIAWGHSSLISPWGDVISTTDEKEGIIYGNIDLSYVNEVRQQIPIRDQQRNDLYNIVSHSSS